MLRRLLQFVRFDVLSLPLWGLLAMLAFIYLVDWLSGGRLTH